MIALPPDVRGLIFDCDGTIADTMPAHYEAWVTALGEYQVDFPEALFYEFAGITTIRIIEILNERHGRNMSVAETSYRKEMLYLNLIHQVRPIAPVINVIRAQAGKLPMAVASGGGRMVVMKTLAAMEVLDLFQAVVTGDDVKNSKPAPDIFLAAAREINVEPAHCVVFEDADLGVQAATAAGMRVIDVRDYGFGPKLGPPA